MTIADQLYRETPNFSELFTKAKIYQSPWIELCKWGTKWYRFTFPDKSSLRFKANRKGELVLLQIHDQ
jgi:hypothetical protein